MKNLILFFLLLTTFLANGQYHHKHHSNFAFTRQHPRIEVTVPDVKTSFHHSTFNPLIQSRDYAMMGNAVTQPSEAAQYWKGSQLFFTHDHRVQGSQTYDIQGKPQFSSAAFTFRSKKRH